MLGDKVGSMSLNQKAFDQRSIKGTAKEEDKVRAVLKTVGVEGLIAQPMN